MTKMLCLLSACLLLAPFSFADSLEFGDNTSPNANNGICDDPRFEGSKANPNPQRIDRFHDANDCRDLYNKGSIVLAGTSGIDFGDDSGNFTLDGECDDPRFVGSGASSAGTAGTDASDCRTQFALGNIQLRPTPKAVPLFLNNGQINFGNDSGNYPNDGDCDDPRFAGPGTTSAGELADVGGDRSDCEQAYRNGDAFIKTSVADNVKNIDNTIDFGDDSGNATLDGECDDQRFIGDLVYESSSEKTDATDCKVLYLSGLISLYSEPDLYLPDGSLNFGDDSGTYANDGECDDARFAGPGAAATTSRNHIARDRTDCEQAYRNGDIYLKSSAPTNTSYANINFGDDSGAHANDGECDDPRFDGPGSSNLGLAGNSYVEADATDCLELFKAGRVHLKGGNPIDASIDFGNNESNYAFDGECDDPRFEGPGMASFLVDEDIKRDAFDCRELMEAGRINLIESSVVDGSANKGAGGQAPAQGIDFGNDTSLWANDNVCDDPRFVGSGMAGSLSDNNIRRDASDCRAAYDAGEVRLR